MKFCIYGAGAIGGYIAVQLALAGHDVCVIARGAHERAVGCVVEPACEVAEPGVIAHHALKRFILGEPDRSRSARTQALSEALVGAGFEAPVREDVRWNIWLKLWGNVCFNPISALTGATLDRIVAEPALRDLCRAIQERGRGAGLYAPLGAPLRESRRGDSSRNFEP
jgi:2-dehydropantoate 2-reductase